MTVKPHTEVTPPLIQLYHLDCLEGMARLLPPRSVSVVVTSPPYNIGIRYRSYNDARPRAEYLDWIGRVAGAIERVLAPEGSFFLNMGSRPADPWLPWEVAARVRAYFVLQNVIHWIKAIAIDKQDVGNYPGLTADVAVGHYKPINSPRYVHDCHEYIFHFTRTGAVKLDRLAVGVPYRDKSNIGRWRWATRDLRCRGNTWFLPYETIRNRALDRPHPSSFPVQLPERCLKLHGLERIKLVLDPFVGIGATALAAQRLGLACVGFDTDDYYLDVAAERLRGASASEGRTSRHRGEKVSRSAGVSRCRAGQPGSASERPARRRARL